MIVVDGSRIVSGVMVFKMVDQHGMPIAVLNAQLRERGLGFNVPEFIDAARKAGWKNRTIKTSLLDDIMIPKEAVDKINELLK